MSTFPTSIPRCQHIKVNGTQCGSPALRRYRFCYFHKRWHQQRILINTRSARKVRASIDMPVLEDANSVQVAVMQIMNLILSGRIDTKSAGLLLYALQTASLNLKHTRFEPLETRVIIDPRNVPDTPLGADPWSEEDYEDLEDEEDYDGEDDDIEDDDEDNEGGVDIDQARGAALMMMLSTGTIPRVSGPAKTDPHTTLPNLTGQKTQTEVDFSQFDDDDKTAWAASDEPARRSWIEMGYIPLVGKPPIPQKPWKVQFEPVHQRLARENLNQRKPTTSETTMTPANSRNRSSATNHRDTSPVRDDCQ